MLTLMPHPTPFPIPRRSVWALALTLAAVPSTLAAQTVPVPPPTTQGPLDDEGWAAYSALVLTPDAGLAPSAGYLLARPGERLEALRISVRAAGVERNAFTDQRVYAATLDLPMRIASLAITAGYVDFSCDEIQEWDCRGGWQAGARLGRSLWSQSLDAAGTNVLVVGAEATAGFADATVVEVARVEVPEIGDVTWQAFTASVALPVGVRARVGRVTVAPMVAPRLAWGRATLEVDQVSRDTGSGARFVLGAGVAVRLGRHLGLEAGLQRVHVDGAGTAYGVAASIGF